MTTPVRIQQSIRQLETKGLTHTQIARELGVSRTTVVKYATRDYSPVPPTGGTASRSLVAGEYARKADEWLEADRRMPRKQRHTARRVHERLVEECGFEGSYSSVQRWVKRWRQRHRGEAEGFSELEWAPGSAQVDFGQALAVVAGVERTVHFLVVSFPYSNMRYVAALPGETAECVCHGLNKVFSHAGMVPRVLVFDNATGVGHRRADGTVTQTRLFAPFRDDSPLEDVNLLCRAVDAASRSDPHAADKVAAWAECWEVDDPRVLAGVAVRSAADPTNMAVTAAESGRAL